MFKKNSSFSGKAEEVEKKYRFGIQKIPKAPNGKKIKNVEVFINLKN